MEIRYRQRQRCECIGSLYEKIRGLEHRTTCLPETFHDCQTLTRVPTSTVRVITPRTHRDDNILLMFIKQIKQPSDGGITRLSIQDPTIAFPESRSSNTTVLCNRYVPLNIPQQARSKSMTPVTSPSGCTKRLVTHKSP